MSRRGSRRLIAFLGRGSAVASPSRTLKKSAVVIHDGALIIRRREAPNSKL
jgi:hypothetical protein